MEVFVKVLAEDMMEGEVSVCATAFLTFVALDADGNLMDVPTVIPETEEETFLYEGAPKRVEQRKTHRKQSREFAAIFETGAFFKHVSSKH